MTQAEINDLFLRIFRRLEPFVDDACNKFIRGFRHITAEDLKQECAIKLFQILSENKGKLLDKKEKEIYLIFQTSVYNLLRDIYRNQRRYLRDSSIDADTDSGLDLYEVSDSAFTPYEHLLYGQYIELVKQRLDSLIEKQVFDLLLHPDAELLFHVFYNWRITEKRREQGEIVMSSTMKVNIRHLAARLSTSPATISRALTRIRQTIANMLRHEYHGSYEE